MISYADAKKLLLDMNPIFGDEIVKLENAVGRQLRENIYARVALPSDNNSAMDGYAFAHKDIKVNNRLRLIGTILAKQNELPYAPDYQEGACVRIMTGGVLPAWADTVVRLEDTVLKNDCEIELVEPAPKLGLNIRKAGEDFQEQQLVLKSGIKLTPEHIMVAAALGYNQLQVSTKPRLVLLSTGDELVEPGNPLPRGAVYNSSKYYLIAAAASLGITPEAIATVPDSPELAKPLIEDLCNSDRPTILISTGAVSMGEADFIPSLAQDMGFEAKFHKVAIRPGKPVFFATKGQTAWLGLPGNPVSTAVGWVIFGRPLISKWFSCPDVTKKKIILKNEVKKSEEFRCFFRAEINNGQAWVSRNQGSGNLSASINCGAYVELPEGISRFAPDTPIEAIII